jgi:phage-related protein
VNEREFSWSQFGHKILATFSGNKTPTGVKIPVGARSNRLRGILDKLYKYLYSHPVSEKPIFWVASSLDDVRSFPEDARHLVGHFLHIIQQGLEPPDWKPMASVGQVVYEIRIHTRVEHRVFYLAKFSEGIYVLHAFQKKTRSTSTSDIDLARRRLKQLVRERGSQRDQR